MKSNFPYQKPPLHHDTPCKKEVASSRGGRAFRRNIKQKESEALVSSLSPFQTDFEAFQALQHRMAKVTHLRFHLAQSQGLGHENTSFDLLRNWVLLSPDTLKTADIIYTKDYVLHLKKLETLIVGFSAEKKEQVIDLYGVKCLFLFRDLNDEKVFIEGTNTLIAAGTRLDLGNYDLDLLFEKHCCRNVLSIQAYQHMNNHNKLITKNDQGNVVETVFHAPLNADFSRTAPLNLPSDAETLLSYLPDNTYKKELIAWVIRLISCSETQFCFAYGLHGVQEEVAGKYLLTYIHALPKSENKRINIIFAITDMDMIQSESLQKPLMKNGVLLVTPTSCFSPPTLATGDTAVILTNYLPKIVFETLLSHATLPVIVEGTNSTALARQYGKCYLPIVRTLVRNNHFSLSEIEQHPSIIPWAYTTNLSFFDYRKWGHCNPYKLTSCTQLPTEEVKNLVDVFFTTLSRQGKSNVQRDEFMRQLPEFIKAPDNQSRSDACTLFSLLEHMTEEPHPGCFSLEILWLIEKFHQGDEINFTEMPPQLSLERKKKIIISIMEKPESFFLNFLAWIDLQGQELLRNYMEAFFTQSSYLHDIAKRFQLPFQQPENDKLFCILKQLPEEIFTQMAQDRSCHVPASSPRQNSFRTL